MSKTKLTRVATIGTNKVFDAFKTSYTGKEHRPDEEDHRSSDGQRSGLLVTSMAPLFISMSIFGLSDYWKLLGKYGIRGSFRSRGLKVYRIAVVVVYMANVVRFFPAFANTTEFGALLMSNVMVEVWFLHCFVNGMICYKMVENPNKLRNFFTLWEKYWKRGNEVWGNTTGDEENAKICKRMRKVTSICTIIGWCFVFVNVTFTIFTSFVTKTFEIILTPFSSTNPHAFEIKACMQIIQFYLSGIWVFACLVLFLVSLTLYYATKQFANKFDELKSKSVTEVNDNMEAFRDQYNYLCDMIDAVDDTFQFYIGISLFTNILLMLIVMYNLCWYENVRNTLAELIAHIFWMFGISFMLVLQMAMCCVVNTWVS